MSYSKVLRIFAEGGAAVLGVLTLPAAAQVSVTAPAPYYAMPSWDQILTANRFVVLSNWNGEAVLDRETGLVWERTPSLARYPMLSDIWGWTATDHCVSLTIANRAGWRVPSIQELLTLVDSWPALPAGHPFNIGSTSDVFFWSSTQYVTPSRGPAYRQAWIGFMSGISSSALRPDALSRVWCVRGGSGNPNQ